MRQIDSGLAKAIQAAGSAVRLARKLDISHQAVMQWRTIPAHQIVAVERVTGIPREELRPELYRR